MVWDLVGNRTTFRSANEVKVDTVAPAAPSDAVATETTATTTTLGWTASSDAVGVVGYGVYRDGVRIANTSALRYRAAWLDCERTYRFAIDAVDAAGHRSRPVELDVTTGSCPAPSTDASVFVSPTGSDTAPCTQLEPCLSFDRGYKFALPGQVVEVAPGTYTDQIIQTDPAKTSTEPVVFRAAPGTAPVVGIIDVEASNVHVHGVQTAYSLSPGGEPVQGAAAIGRGTVGVVLEDVDAGNVFIAGDDAVVRGGDFGPTVDEVSRVSGTSGDPTRPPRNIVVDGAAFHDFLREEAHMECMTIEGADGLAIRNSTFNNCAVFALFIKEFGGGDLVRGLTIENNFFANTLGINMAAMIKLTTPASQPPCNDILIRHNTITDKFVQSECPGTNIRWESNVIEHLPETTCEDRPPGTTFDFNVIERGAPCGSNDLLVADAGLRDRGGFDLHLRPDSAAIDRGNPADAPAADIDGDLRPQGAAPDAGADEVG